MYPSLRKIKKHVKFIYALSTCYSKLYVTTNNSVCRQENYNLECKSSKGHCIATLYYINTYKAEWHNPCSDYLVVISLCLCRPLYCPLYNS